MVDASIPRSGGLRSQVPGRVVLVTGTTAGAVARREDRPERTSPLPLADWLAALPLASLLVGADGSAQAVNPAWTTLSGRTGPDSLGDGWLGGVDPLDRELLVERLRSSRTARTAGTFECRLVGAGPRRWTRWWWQPTAEGGLVVCVADIDEEKALEAVLWQRATHDPLTGLLNRTQLLELLDRALQRRDRSTASPAVLFIDLDDFKAVNDQDGHHAGDQVLQELARRVASAIRPADVAARIGGDEFAVLCEDLREPAEAMAIAERVRRAVARPVDLAAVTTVVTATTGVALAEPDDTAEDILARADRSMYAHKRPHLTLAGEPSSPPDGGAPAPVPLPAAVLRTRPAALHALVDAERLLAQEWSRVLADHRLPPEARDRIARASRLASAAVRALDPASVL